MIFSLEKCVNKALEDRSCCPNQQIMLLEGYHFRNNCLCIPILLLEKPSFNKYTVDVLEDTTSVGIKPLHLFKRGFVGLR